MTTIPTPAQLHHLADRARRGVALPAEHDQLAAGITAMAARVEQAEAELRALKTVTTSYCPHCGRGDCSPTADQWYAQRTRADRAEAAIERVRELHQPAPDWSWAAFGCTHRGEHKTECPACGGCYPCATAAALPEQQPTTTEASHVA